MSIIPELTLKQRAIAAYEAAQERKAHEEAEKEAQAKRAHEDNLRTLCTQVLDIDATLLPIRYVERFCWPFVDVDGLLFTCPPDRERLELAACVSASDVYQKGTEVESVEHLGKILCDAYFKPCRIEGTRLVPAHQSAGGE